MTIETYPEMNTEIIKILRFSDDASLHYAAQRIEELEAEVERLRRESRVRAKCLALAMEVLGWYASDVLIGRRANSVLGEIGKHLAQLEPGNEPAPDALPCGHPRPEEEAE